MKKIILTSLFLFFGSSTVNAFDGVFLDQIPNKIYRNKKVSIRDSKILLELSSEAPREKKELIEQESKKIVQISSEDSSIQEIKEPVVMKARRDFSFLVMPKKENVETLFEISNRNFPSSLQLVRNRQKVARKKAMRYREMFQL